MFSKGSSSIILNEIMSKTNEFSILSYYLGIIKIPCVINSPLRKDVNPSFSLYSRDGNSIKFIDFATRQSGGTFDLLGLMWNMSFQDVLNKIYKDLNNFSTTVNTIHISNGPKKTYSKDTNLECKIRELRDYDVEYWETYGISPKWLKFGDIYPISHIIVTKNGVRKVIPADKYAYAYVERKDNKVSLKIYQPYSTTHKWSNKHDSSVWDLWTKLPNTGDKLIITSSRKDALCIWENTGIPSVSLQAESCLPKEHVVEELKSRFTHIYVLYDNDFKSKENHGRILGKIIADRFNIKQIEIPEKYQSKDTSDLAKNHGRNIVKQLIKELTL